MPAVPRAGGKSQYELERDARVAANKERMAALGIGRAAAALAATKVRVCASLAPQLLRCTELPDLRRLLSVGALEIDLPAFVGALERCSVTEHDLLALRLAPPSMLSTPCGA